MAASSGVLLPAFAFTLAGSVHCVSMCGGFALAVAAGRRKFQFLFDHILLQLGKATSYLFLGALAGRLGAALLRSGALLGAERALAIVAGLATIGAGLILAGLGGGRNRFAEALAPVFSSTAGRLLVSRPPGAPLVAGLALGFLPCPLVYAGLLAAAATGNPLEGALTLAGVALGSVPALLLVAFLGSAGSGVLRHRLARVAAVVLIVLGGVTLLRGVTSLDSHSAHCAGVPALP